MRFFQNHGSRLLVFCCGVIVAFCLAECFLLGLCIRQNSVLASKSSDPLVVLCVGRSFSAESDSDFCSFLEESLNAGKPDQYRVINRVLPSFKSSVDAVFFLEHYLAEFNPHAVVFLDQATSRLRTFKYNVSGFTPPYYHLSSLCKIFYGVLREYFNVSLFNLDTGHDVVFRHSLDLKNLPQEKLLPELENLRGQGFYLMDMNDYTGAEQIFEKLIKLYPDSVTGYEGLARVYAQTGKKQKAVELYRKIISRWPDNSCQYIKLALCAGTEYPEDADKSFEKFFTLEPYEPTMKNRYADWLRSMGRVEAAGDFAEKIIQQGLGTAKTLEIMALCYAPFDANVAVSYANLAQAYALDYFNPTQREYLRAIVDLCRKNNVRIFVDVQPNFLGYRPFLKLLGYPLGLKVVSLLDEFVKAPETTSELFSSSYETLTPDGARLLAKKTADTLKR